jgi:hypothetical protein
LTTRRLVICGLALAATAVTLLPVCNAVFDCGCTWPLLGAADHCNIHHPSPPHCPLCRNWGYGALGAGLLFAAWASSLALVARLTLRPR